MGSQWCNRLSQEEEGIPDEGDTEGSGRAMNAMTVKVLSGFALFFLVVALTLVALMLVVPLVTPELTPSGYY